MSIYLIYDKYEINLWKLFKGDGRRVETFY